MRWTLRCNPSKPVWSTKTSTTAKRTWTITAIESSSASLAGRRNQFRSEQAVKELGETAELTFRYGTSTNDDGSPAGEIVISGKDVKKAGTAQQQDSSTGDAQWVVTLQLTDEGSEAFYNATSSLYQSNGQISIWMDNNMISAPTVNSVISDGECTITGNFTYESAKELADKINSGSLPFSLETTSFKTISRLWAKAL